MIHCVARHSYSMIQTYNTRLITMLNLNTWRDTPLLTCRLIVYPALLFIVIFFVQIHIICTLHHLIIHFIFWNNLSLSFLAQMFVAFCWHVCDIIFICAGRPVSIGRSELVTEVSSLPWSCIVLNHTFQNNHVPLENEKYVGRLIQHLVNNCIEISLPFWLGFSRWTIHVRSLSMWRDTSLNK